MVFLVAHIIAFKTWFWSSHEFDIVLYAFMRSSSIYMMMGGDGDKATKTVGPQMCRTTED